MADRTDVGSFYASTSSFGPPLVGARCVGCGCTNNIRIHYGGASCHGCKAFFRRTIYENRKYECTFKNACEINFAYRNRCRACRFRNCLKGGMDSKFVREERGKINRSHSAGPPQVTTPTHMTQIPELAQDTIPKSDPEIQCIQFEDFSQERQLIQFLVDLEVRTDQLRDDSIPVADHLDTYGRDVSITLGLQNPHLVIRRSPVSFSLFLFRLFQLDWTCSRLMNSVDMYLAWYRSFVLMADYAMGIPEFRSLPLLDQTRLFKENFTAFGWIVYAYRCFSHGLSEVGMPIGNGSYIPIRKHELDMIEPRWAASYGPVGRALIEMIVVPMKEMNMTFAEFTILKAIALFQPDCHLSPQASVTCAQMREKLSRMLSLQIDTTFPHLSTAERIMRATKGTLLLPSLYQIGRLEAELIQKLNPGELHELGGVPLEILSSYRQAGS